MTITKAQLNLLNAMSSGAIVYFMAGINAYYFRTDTMKNCTKTAQALEKKGLVEKYDQKWNGYALRIKP